MSSFEIQGTVNKVEKLTSAKGNPYIVFQISDGNKTFDLSLFGDGMQFAAKLKPKKEVTVKGTLSTREYLDKNQKTRNNVELRVAWVETVTVELDKKTGRDPMDVAGIDDVPF